VSRRRDVHTVPNPTGSGWVNEVAGRVVSSHRKKEPAVSAGRQMARQQQAEHVIHNTDGRISQSNSYGNDPLPPRDRR
jgi:hypothetical protein